MTLAQRDEAYRTLSLKHEPSYQRSDAIVLLTRVRETLKWEYAGDFLDKHIVNLMSSTAEEVVEAWRNEPKRQEAGTEFYRKVGVTLSLPDRPYGALTIEPNKHLKRMLLGEAPLRLFNPSDEVLGNMWAEEQTLP